MTKKGKKKEKEKKDVDGGIEEGGVEGGKRMEKVRKGREGRKKEK